MAVAEEATAAFFKEVEAAQAQGHQQKTQAQRLVELASDADLFHTPDGEPYITIPVGEHRETWPVKVKAVRRWLQRRFYAEEGRPPGAQGMQDALGVLEARAIFDGPEAPVFVRVAENQGKVLIDLGDADWRAVEVGPAGWQVIEEPPVRFIRAKGMLPLPLPERGGSLEELRPFLNAQDDDTWTLMVAWLVGALQPSGPYPVLILQGEQGTAKSTTARLLRSLVDPSSVPLRTVPREERDLAIAASRAWVVSLDNLSGLPGWASDAICRLATGGGFGTRELYSDNEEVLFSSTRPVMLNGIEDVASRQDLTDRAIILNLAPIEDKARVQESELDALFSAAAPTILGALLDAVSAGLRNRRRTRLAKLPRMADFAAWVVACEESLPWEQGTFLRAYFGNRADAIEASIEADPVASAVRTMVERIGSWEGTSSDLLARLEEYAAEPVLRTKGWPKTPRALSGKLRRAATFLRVAGTEVLFLSREPGTGRRLIRLEQSTR